MNTILEKTTTISSSLLLVLVLALASPVSAVPTSHRSEPLTVAPEAISEKIRQIPSPGPRNPGYPRYPRPVEVDIWTGRGEGASYRIGDPIAIYFRTSIDAFVTIYDLDTRGRINVLFPSRYSRDNFVYGGRTYSLPANGSYHLAVEGPRGREHLRAVASTDPDYRRGYGEPSGLTPEFGRAPVMTPSGLDRAIYKQIVEIPSGPASSAIAETSFFVRRSYWSRPRYRSRYPGRHR